jgi:ribosomal protein S8E
MAGDDKEGSGLEQTTTNHCALKAGVRQPAERAVGNKKGERRCLRGGRETRRRIMTAMRMRTASLPSQDAKVDLKPLIVAIIPIYYLSETINVLFFLFLSIFN